MEFTKKTRSTIGEAIKVALVLVALAGILWVYGHATYAQSVEAQYKSPPLPKNPGAWLTTAWTADSTPYVTMRTEINGKAKAGTSVKNILAQERLNAMEHPKDFAAQYRWLVAANLAAPDGENFDGRALAAVASLDPGNIAVVARSRWIAIMLTQQNEDHPALQPLAERLIALNPKDRNVRLHLIYDLCAGRPGPSSVKPLAKALTMAKAWVEEEPSNPSSHSVLAYVWESYYNQGNRRIYAQKSIDEFKEYLRLAPPRDEFRQGAEIQVKGLTKRLPTMK